MRQTIFSVLMLVLCMYEANGQCVNPDPNSFDELDILQDFVRSRLDQYRKAYNAFSSPYSTTPQKIISQAAYLKATNVDEQDLSDCGFTDIRYQWVPRLGLSICCERDLCAEKYIKYTFADAGFDLPTDVINYKFVVSGGIKEDIDVSNIEQFVDELVEEGEGAEAIFSKFYNVEWGSAIGKPQFDFVPPGMTYLVFASADYSGNNNVSSTKCLPFKGKTLESSSPVPLDVTTTSTLAPSPHITPSGQCINPNPDSIERLDIFQDFVRTRLDQYRKVYNSQSVPYSLQPQTIISAAAYLKAAHMDWSDPNECYDVEQYLWGMRIGLDTCCDRHLCIEHYMKFHFADATFDLATDVHKYRVVASPAYYNTEIGLNNIEAVVDTLVRDTEALEAIFNRYDNDKWGSAISRSFFHPRYRMLAFVSAEDSGNNSTQSATCLPFEETSLTSISPVSSSFIPTTTTTTTINPYAKGNQCLNPYTGGKHPLNIYQDFVRTRSDAYRQAYNPNSVPYSTTPQKIISLAAYLKIESVPSEDAGNCGQDDLRYLWGGQLTNGYCCERYTCTEKVLNAYYANLPTNVANYRVVMSHAYPDITLNNIQEVFDDLIQEEKAVEAIFYRPENNKWGSAVKASLYVKSDNYLAFVTAEESGNNSRLADTCLPFDKNPHPSNTPIFWDYLPPTTTTTTTTTTFYNFHHPRPGPPHLPYPPARLLRLRGTSPRKS